MPFCNLSRSFLTLLAAFLILAQAGCGSGPATVVGTTPTPGQTGYPAASTQRWSREFGSTGALAFPTNQIGPLPDALPGIAGTSSGGVILAGYTRGTYAGYTNPSGTAQAVILRFDRDGNQQWVQQFGTGTGDFLVSAVTDASENIYVAGASNGTYPGQPAFSGGRALLARLDRSGSRTWLKEFALGPGNTGLTAVATDGANSLFVAGFYIPSPSGETQYAFVKKIDALTGNETWSLQYGTVGVIALVNGLAATPATVYVAGGNLTSKSTAQSSTDMQRLAATNGTLLWTQNLATTSKASLVSAIAIGQDDSPFIAGSVSSSTQLLVGYGADASASGFLSKLDPATGKTTWTVSVTSGQGDQITSLNYLRGSLYAAGFTNGALSSSYKTQNSGEFLLKATNTGEVAWVQQFGSGSILNFQTPYGISLANDGTLLYVSGPTQASTQGSPAARITQNVLSSWDL